MLKLVYGCWEAIKFFRFVARLESKRKSLFMDEYSFVGKFFYKEIVLQRELK